jgi:hypothetical protein
MSERHVTTTEDLAKQHTAPVPRFSQEHDEPRADEFPEQQDTTGFRESVDTEDDRVGEHRTVESGFEDEPVDEPVDEQPAAVAEETKTTEPQRTQLFAAEESERFRDNWRTVQGDFVDDPRRAVQQADELVAEVMQTLASTFADHKRTLEEQWSRGGDAQTEDLRLALMQYRTFFQQLLSI